MTWLTNPYRFGAPEPELPVPTWGVVEHAQDFAVYRGGDTPVSQPYSGIMGAGTSCIVCPSSWGWAMQKVSTVSNNMTLSFNVALRRKFGQSAVFTLNLPTSVGSVTLLDCYRTSTNNYMRLLYNAATNKLQFGRDLSVLIGSEFEGPADPTQPFELAFEAVRDGAAGIMRAWVNGVLKSEQIGINTGVASDFDTVRIIVPGGVSGGGNCTFSNWISWDPDVRGVYPGQRRLRRLAPIADYQQQWSNPGSNNYAYAADAGVGATTLQPGAAGREDLYDMAALANDGLIEAMVIHTRNTLTSDYKARLVNADGAVEADLSSGYAQSMFPAAWDGKVWTKERINATRLGLLSVASSGIAISHAHALAMMDPA